MEDPADRSKAYQIDGSIPTAQFLYGALAHDLFLTDPGSGIPCLLQFSQNSYLISYHVVFPIIILFAIYTVSGVDIAPYTVYNIATDKKGVYTNGCNNGSPV